MIAGIEPTRLSSSEEMWSGSGGRTLWASVATHKVALKKNGGWGGELNDGEYIDESDTNW